MIFVQIYIKTYDLDEKQIICPHCPCNFMACIMRGCRDTTDLQPLVCRAVTPWQPQNAPHTTSTTQVHSNLQSERIEYQHL